VTAQTITEDEREVLRRTFPRESYVNTLIRHVSASRMTRWVSVLVADDEGPVWDMSGPVARAAGLTFDRRHGAIKMTGVSSDAEWEVVNALGSALYSDESALHHQRV